MSKVVTPSSLKWLINQRARLMGDIERLQKTHSERIAMNRQQVVQAEDNLRRAKEMLSYEENVVTQKIQILNNNLTAIDIALGMHHIQINPDCIPAIRSHPICR